MSKQLLVNLPVSDPAKAKTFFEKMGLTLNAELSDEQATCFNVDDNIVIALLPADHFKDAINGNEVADARKTNEVLLAIGRENKDGVDDLAGKAVDAGANELYEPVDMPDIYARTFADLDGHLWNVFYKKS